MHKLLVTLLSFSFIWSVSFAQDYNAAVGLRLGYPLSLTYKTFISETNALEGYAGFRSFGRSVSFLSLNAAYQIHKDIEDVDKLQWYYGVGANIAFWSGDFLNSNTSFGVAGYAGISYTFEDIPLNLSLDWIPTFFINGNNGFADGFGGAYGSLAGRYILSSK